MIVRLSKFFSTIAVGLLLVFLIDLGTRLPRETGIPITWGLVVGLLSFWWMAFISVEKCDAE